MNRRGDRSLPAIVGPGLKVILCGPNPGLAVAASGHSFVGRGNRFWRVLHLAGFTPVLVEAENDTSLLDFGLGVTSLVAADIDGLRRSEFVALKLRWLGVLAVHSGCSSIVVVGACSEIATFS